MEGNGRMSVFRRMSPSRIGLIMGLAAIAGCVIDPNTIDYDGDGVPDITDAFPADPTEYTDSDGDGVGDNTDEFPQDPTRTGLEEEPPDDDSGDDDGDDDTDGGPDEPPDETPPDTGRGGGRR